MEEAWRNYHEDDQDADMGFDLDMQDSCGQVTVQPNPLDFGPVAAGVSSTVTARISNVGDCSLEIGVLLTTKVRASRSVVMRKRVRFWS